MHSLWIKLPDYIIGILIFGYIIIYGIVFLTDNEKKPKWLGVLIISLACLATPAYFAAFEEKRVIAAFAEWFVANTLLYAIPISAFVAGYFFVTNIYKATSKKWIAWFVGILIGLIMAISMYNICRNITGIGWRMEKILEEQEEVDGDFVQ